MEASPFTSRSRGACSPRPATAKSCSNAARIRPSDSKAAQELASNGSAPLQVHNNCSGKHAGMLAVAAHAGAEARNYSAKAHPVQRGVAEVLDQLCDVETADLPCGVDGCSVPTWGIPLRNLGLGFQRFLSGETLAPERARAATRITQAVRTHPYMVAGRKRSAPPSWKRCRAPS